MHAQPTSKDRRWPTAALTALTATALVMLATAASASAAHAARPHAHALDAQITSGWKLPAIIAALLVLALAVALGNWLVIRTRHRRSARPRREIPGTALILLTPIYRYDYGRDAWILRIIGARLGPVLRPRGYGAVPVTPRHSTLTPDRPKPTATPEPFATAPAPGARRPRTNRTHTTGQQQDHEPPGLTTRRPPD